MCALPVVLSRLLAVTSLANPQPQTLYSWKFFEYDWDAKPLINPLVRDTYNYSPVIPMDVDYAPDGRVFVTIMRNSGVPASVHTLSNKYGNESGGPLLVPYPDWSWYQDQDDCPNRIISVYRVFIDNCKRLWALDSGFMDLKHICPAKVLAFDLRTDKLVHKLIIPDEISRNTTTNAGLLVTPMIQYLDQNCHDPKDAKIFMADSLGHALVVWNGKEFRRITGDVYVPEMDKANLTIAGISFAVTDGIQGMALSSPYLSREQYLAFRPFASLSMYMANTMDLLYKPIDEIRYLKGKDVLESQGSAMTFASDGTLFYGNPKEIGLNCYNVHEPLGDPDSHKLLLKAEDELQFISGMKIVRYMFGSPIKHLLTMSNRLQKVWVQALNFTEVNYRIVQFPLPQLLRRCRFLNIWKKNKMWHNVRPSLTHMQ